MLELHIPDTEAQSGTVPVSWCVSPDALKMLAEKKVAEPYLLLIAAPQENYSNRREVRKLVPLRDLMTFIEFRVPGVNRIFGLIVWWDGESGKKGLRSLQGVYLSRTSGSYLTDILEADGSAVSAIGEEARRWSDRYRGQHEVGVSASLDVAVPRECFAKEPPEWEKRWVNLMWRQRPEDQCDYRRRRLWAYSGQMFVVAPIVYAFRLVAALFLLLLLGMRKISFGPLLRPLDRDTRGIWSDAFWEDDKSCGTYFVPKWTKRPIRYVFLAFMPLLWLPAVLIMTLGCGFSVGGALFWTYAGWIALIATIAAVAIGIGLFVDRLGKARDRARAAEERWYLREEEMRHLVCNGNAPRGLKDLPKNRRTIRLRFLDLKAKVCRPFAS